MRKHDAPLDTGSHPPVRSGPGVRSRSPIPRHPVKLLIAVINHEEKMDEILSGFVELGVTGATLLNSEGMGRILSHDVPIFAGVPGLAAASRPRNQTLFSVMEADKVDGVIALLREICGDLGDPATGIVFTVPVDQVLGLSGELGRPA